MAVTEIVLAVVLFLGMEACLYLYLDSPKRGSLFWKACATLMPVLLCLSGSLRSGGEHYLLLAALCVCLISDVLIGVHFVSGVLSFLTAHILLMVYLVRQAPPTLWSLLPWAVLYGLLWLYYGKEIPTLGKRAVPMCLYRHVFSCGCPSVFAARSLVCLSRAGGRVLLCVGYGAGRWRCS